jgi:hypothetical protein
MKQQLSNISEIKIKLPKNAKLFFDNERGLYFLVHYDHVILTLANTIPKRALSVYAGSPTSQNAIEYVSFALIPDEYHRIEYFYEQVGKTREQLKSDRHDFKASNTGVYNKPRMVKADWSERISALEKYDYTKGNYLFQDSLPYTEGTETIGNNIFKTKTYQINPSACPHLIFSPEHYRADNSCKCNEPNNKLMKENGYKWSAKKGMWV